MAQRLFKAIRVRGKAVGILLALSLLTLGWARLEFDVNVLHLLPDDVPSVHGLDLYSRHFAGSQELIVGMTASNAEEATAMARSLSTAVGRLPGVAHVRWRSPWQESPEQLGELIGYLWLNQSEDVFGTLTNRLSASNRVARLQETRDRLTTSFSPMEIGRLSRDPYGLTRVPDVGIGKLSRFQAAHFNGFVSRDGTFRILVVESARELNGYKACAAWVETIRDRVLEWRRSEPDRERISIQLTGDAMFSAEIGSGMEKDMKLSVGVTFLFVVIAFGVLHRSWRPLGWLSLFLFFVLGATLAIGGLLMQSLNVVSVGFAAILLGLAVDYALVLYHESRSVPEAAPNALRYRIAPGVVGSAGTTAIAFITVSLCSLPGMRQLGVLVAIGITLAAAVLLFVFLPLHYRMNLRRTAGGNALSSPPCDDGRSSRFVNREGNRSSANPTSSFSGLVRESRWGDKAKSRMACGITALVIVGGTAILMDDMPAFDASSAPLRPRDSEAFRGLKRIGEELGGSRRALWLIVGGRDESVVRERLEATRKALKRQRADGKLAEFVLPLALWPNPQHQRANRSLAYRLAKRREAVVKTALGHGFTRESLRLTEGVFHAWGRAADMREVFWPTNQASQWILSKVAARDAERMMALGWLYPRESEDQASKPAGALALSESIRASVPFDAIWVTNWSMVADRVLGTVITDLKRLAVPMALAFLAALWASLRRVREVLKSLLALGLSGLLLTAAMTWLDWKWNLLNLMALPLLLGVGVDYSLHLQWALRRHGGDMRMVRRTIGRALMLCAGTSVVGFGTLGASSNGGLASLGRVCAIGILCVFVVTRFLLPYWPPGSRLIQSGGE